MISPSNIFLNSIVYISSSFSLLLFMIGSPYSKVVLIWIGFYHFRVEDLKLANVLTGIETVTSCWGTYPRLSILHNGANRSASMSSYTSSE